MLSLRVSEQGVEMRKLKSKQETLDHSCAEHLVELSDLKKAHEELTKSIEKSWIPDVDEENDENDKENIEQCKTLHAMKNMGSDRFTPQAQPVKRISLFKCGECSFEFTSEDVLDKHKAQHHKKKTTVNNWPAQQQVPPSNIPVVMSRPSRPSGIVPRQYNCHECDYQGHRSKALYRHSILSGHRKIDSLSETCYTCKETFDNFELLMKHRKVAHTDTISECHSFKAGNCRFGNHCYYRHSVATGGVTTHSDFQADKPSSWSKGTDSDSFQEDLELPPDLKELTMGFQSLMSQFLLKREKTRNRQLGF